jgi:hypothetical protein
MPVIDIVFPMVKPAPYPEEGKMANMQDMPKINPN